MLTQSQSQQCHQLQHTSLDGFLCQPLIRISAFPHLNFLCTKLLSYFLQLQKGTVISDLYNPQWFLVMLVI